jgi:hypothetical protein
MNLESGFYRRIVVPLDGSPAAEAVPHDTRRETCFRTLPVQTEAFSRWVDRNKTLELSPKPEELPDGAVDHAVLASVPRPTSARPVRSPGPTSTSA